MPPTYTYDIDAAPPAKKRRGPKPKPLSERGYKVKGPVKRIERSYQAMKKDEVIMYLLHHKVPSKVFMGQARRPSLREAAAHFKIPKSTICGWLKKDNIKLGVLEESPRLLAPAPEPTNPSADQPVNSTSTPPVKNLAAEPVAQPFNAPVTESVNASVNGSNNQPASEPANGPVNEQ